MPRVFGKDARLYAQRRVRAAVQVLGEQRLVFGVGEEVGEQQIEMLDRHRVVVVPPDDRIGLGVADDEFVFRAAAGVHAGVGDQRAVLGDMGLMFLQRELIKTGSGKIPMHRGKIGETEAVCAILLVPFACLNHLAPILMLHLFPSGGGLFGALRGARQAPSRRRE